MLLVCVVSAVGLMNGKYASGDPVFVWSRSKDCRLETTVEKICPDGKIDTKIKHGCLAKHVRRISEPLIASLKITFSDV